MHIPALHLLVLASVAKAAAIPAPNFYTFTVPSTTANVPYYASASLTESSTTVTSIVFSIQGIDRDAASTFTLLQMMASDSGATGPDRVLIAPHFQAKTDDPASNSLIWSGDGWLDGSDSVGPSTTISSFTVIDNMLSQAAVSFPNLVNITLVGFSAGGQTVSRYAAFSKQPDVLAAQTPAIHTRFVVADPGSLTYPTAARIKPVVLRTTCSDTATPQACYESITAADFTPEYLRHAEVPDYDQYKYGLVDRSGYALTQGGARTDVVSRVVSRDIRYLVGDQDVKDNFKLDTSDEANAQGDNRAVRMAVYVKYLQLVLDVADAKLEFVEGCGHLDACVLGAEVARDLVFRA
ncbi:hypothetical protein HKX48_008947 [Thoreauomyces humboldtii]|nr:hypothetical protein HKX48_008947 [Thoreauomyces humboldtii]